jgi:hypothetical protein
MIHALRRGSQVTVDLGDSWDFWPHVERPLAEVRASFAIPPLDRKYASGVGVYGPPIGRW